MLRHQLSKILWPTYPPSALLRTALKLKSHLSGWSLGRPYSTSAKTSSWKKTILPPHLLQAMPAQVAVSIHKARLNRNLASIDWTFLLLLPLDLDPNHSDPLILKLDSACLSLSSPLQVAISTPSTPLTLAQSPCITSLQLRQLKSQKKSPSNTRLHPSWLQTSLPAAKSLPPQSSFPSSPISKTSASPPLSLGLLWRWEDCNFLNQILRVCIRPPIINKIKTPRHPQCNCPSLPKLTSPQSRTSYSNKLRLKSMTSLSPRLLLSHTGEAFLRTVKEQLKSKPLSSEEIRCEGALDTQFRNWYLTFSKWREPPELSKSTPIVIVILL